ncbi:MAG: permease [Gemmatimonadetes bacterium]|nr:permease [Gemmatimonadota bacterium]
MDDRSQRSESLLHALARDAHAGFRALRSSRMSSAVTILTLAIGIGANAAMFSVLQSVLFHPLPVPDIERLVVVQDEIPKMSLYGGRMAAGEVLDLAKDHRFFDAVAGVETTERDFVAGDKTLRVSAASTLGPFFDVFGQRPAHGAFYHTGDDQAGAVVLSQQFWRSTFGGDSAVVGRSIQLDGQSYRITGIARKEFRYPWSVDVWIPYPLIAGSRAAVDRGMLLFTTTARMKPSVPVAAAQAGLVTIMQEWTTQFGAMWYPASYGRRMQAVPLVTFLSGQLRSIVLLLACGMGLLLVMACVNVAVVQLVRAAARMREDAVRAALGATRVQLVRQRIMENGMLAACGGVLAYVTARAIVRYVQVIAPRREMVLQNITIDGTVLAFLLLTTILTLLVFSVAPALGSLNVDPASALGGGGGRSSAVLPFGTRLLHLSVGLQFALSTLLVLSALVVFDNLFQLLDVAPGFRAEGVLTARISVPAYRYQTPAARAGVAEQLLTHVRAVPGVRYAGLTSGLPFTELGASSLVRVPGREDMSGGDDRHATLLFTGGDYFQALEIPVVRGRVFTSADVAGTRRLAVVDQVLVDAFFRGEDPVGKTIIVGGEAEIIGVVGPVKKRDLGEKAEPAVYLSYQQAPGAVRTLSVAVRGTSSPEAIRAALRAAVHDVDPYLPLSEVSTMEERMQSSLAPQRFATTLLVAFAGASLSLAVLGIYGVLSYTTARRAREIAIRMAIGAQRNDVLRAVVGRGVMIAAIGLVAGLVLFFLGTRLASGVLYGMRLPRAVPLVAATALLSVAAVIASWIPSVRALRTNPASLLREG